MSHVEIRVASKTDPKLFPELVNKVIVAGFLEKVGILEGGSPDSVGTSIALVIEIEGHRERLIVDLTASMFLSIGGALKGAMRRFGDDPSGYA